MPVHDALAIRRYTVDEITWESASVYTLNLSPEQPKVGSYSWQVNGSIGTFSTKTVLLGVELRFPLYSAPGEFDEEFQLGVKVQGFSPKRRSVTARGCDWHPRSLWCFYLAKTSGSPRLLCRRHWRNPVSSMIREHRLQSGRRQLPCSIAIAILRMRSTLKSLSRSPKNGSYLHLSQP